MINWHDTEITDPPITRAFVSDYDMIANEERKDFYNLPCHTQAVETHEVSHGNIIHSATTWRRIYSS